MLYKNKFNLTGTEEQQAIVKDALDKIYFPWERLTFPAIPEIGWKNLNGQSLEGALQHKSGTKGIIDGREYTLGVFYTHSGNIYIDNLLVNYPEYAKTTVSAEIAHSVDQFLPLTTDQHYAIKALMHNGDGTDHSHDWWEKFDYGTEYFHLIGEAFMQAFTLAYSDMPFDNSSFTHGITKEQAPELRKIIGIQRTDALIEPIIKKPTMKKKPHKMDQHLVSKQRSERAYFKRKYNVGAKVVQAVIDEIGTISRDQIMIRLFQLGLIKPVIQGPVIPKEWFEQNNLKHELND